MSETDGSPGGHPHSDRRNWAPADTAEDYLRNCREGLETWSERRFANLMGVSRAQLWRWKIYAAIPEDLFEALLSRHVSRRDLTKIGQFLTKGDVPIEAERCPHCGGLLRVRGISDDAVKIFNDWIDVLNSQ